jgi:hypothetical protein
VVIQGCVFEENHEWESPGGLVIWQSRAEIRGCIFRNNSACYGGGLEIYHCEGYGTSVIEENLFTGNQAQVWGGGIFNVDSSPLIRRNTFVGNGTGSNGAIFILGGSPEIVDNIIVGSPHGIACMGYSGYPPSIPVVGRNLLWELGDAPALACADTGEVIALDPGFCDPGAGDYTVCADSPAVIDGTIALGAYPVGCDPCSGTETRPFTWGALKARYP